MDILCIGLSHKTAPVELRERFAIGDAHLGEVSSLLARAPGGRLPLATTNRAVDAAARSVTLTPFAEPDSQPSSGLCRRHADSMVVPIGWLLDDRREEVPRLFKVAPEPRPRRDRRRPTRGPVEVAET